MKYELPACLLYCREYQWLQYQEVEEVSQHLKKLSFINPEKFNLFLSPPECTLFLKIDLSTILHSIDEDHG